MATTTMILFALMGLVGIVLAILAPATCRSAEAGSPPSLDRSTLLLLLLAMSIGLLHQAVYRTNAEDAFITYRYSANLAAGAGPVFNPGERVEGYSNFLLMVLLAGCRYVGIDIVLAARSLGVVFSLLLFWAVYRLAARISGRATSGILAVLVAAFSPPIAAYGPSGMETPLFLWLVVAALDQSLSNRWLRAGLLAGLATMTRPDGVVVFAGMAGWQIWSSLKPQLPAGRVVGNMSCLALGYLCLMLPWTAWRWSYYGYLLPNCLQAKRGMELPYQWWLGLKYLLGFALYHLPWLLLFVGALCASRLVRSAEKQAAIERDAWVLLCVVGAMYEGFIWFIGGDWMPAYRMAALLIPILAILIALALQRAAAGLRISIRLQFLAVLLMAGAVLLLSHSLLSHSLVKEVHEWNQQVADGGQIGRWWKRSLPAETLMASYANGALSYFSQLPTIDMLGLTDEHIARRGQRASRGTPGHIAYDFGYLARRQPAVMFFSGVPFHQQPGGTYPNLFDQAYDSVSFRFTNSTSPYGQYVNLVIRRDRRDELIRRLTDQERGIEFVEVNK